jgi:hypothetical protein
VPESLLVYFARLDTGHLTVVEFTADSCRLNDVLEDHGIE